MGSYVSKLFSVEVTFYRPAFWWMKKSDESRLRRKYKGKKSK